MATGLNCVRPSAATRDSGAADGKAEAQEVPAVDVLHLVSSDRVFRSREKAKEVSHAPLNEELENP